MIKRGLIKIYSALLQWSLTPILLREYWKPTFKNINERSIEYSFLFKHLSRICPKKVLDVGTGKSSLPNLMKDCGFRVTAIDKMESFWKGGFINRHYYVIKDDITNPNISESFDVITAVSVLEHIPDHRKAIEGMFSLLNPGGHLILTFPYNEERYVDNVYRFHGINKGKNTIPYICQVFSRKEINEWIQDNNANIVDQEYYEVFTGKFWSFGKRIHPLNRVTNKEKHHFTCLLIKKA